MPWSQYLVRHTIKKADIARLVFAKHSNLIMNATFKDHAMIVLLFWANEDSQLGDMFEKHPEILIRLSKLTSPNLIMRYIYDAKSQRGWFDRSRTKQYRGRPIMTDAQRLESMHRSWRKSSAKWMAKHKKEMAKEKIAK